MAPLSEFRFVHSRVEGSEPVHVEVFSDTRRVLTAYGRETGDRWVLGWSTGGRLGWKLLVGLAASSLSYAGLGRFGTYFLHDDELVELTSYKLSEGATDNLIAAQVVSDFSEIEEVVGNFDMIVLGKEDVQIEIIFTDHRPSSLSLLASSNVVPFFAHFVGLTHENDMIREHRPGLALRMLEEVLGSNLEGKLAHGQENEGAWRQPFAGSKSKES